MKSSTVKKISKNKNLQELLLLIEEKYNYWFNLNDKSVLLLTQLREAYFAGFIEGVNMAKAMKKKGAKPVKKGKK